MEHILTPACKAGATAGAERSVRLPGERGGGGGGEGGGWGGREEPGLAAQTRLCGELR